MNKVKLAIIGGTPIRSKSWPIWPKGDKKSKSNLLKVLYSGRWAISGPYLGKESFERKFSREFANFNKAKYCTPVSNGSSSLLSALIALGIGRGDEVIVPGLTWVACATTVLAVGAKPVIVDVDPSNLCISLDETKKAITKNTKAIMIVHAFGAVADLRSFKSLSEETSLPLIEDCSQAHGAMWDGKFVGTIGDFGCFSMQQSKLLTSGEGGAVITNSNDLYLKAEQARSDGRIFADSPKHGSLELKEAGDVQGHNMCLSEFQSAVLLGQLEKLHIENEKRAVNARKLLALLDEIDGVSSINYYSPGVQPVFYNFVIKFDRSYFSGKSIDAISAALSEELNFFVRPIYKPMDEHPLYQPGKSFRHEEGERVELASDIHLPKAKEARETCLAFHHSVLLEEDGTAMHDIANAIKKLKGSADQIPEVENLAAI